MKVDNKDIIKIMQIIKSSMYGIEYYDRKKILNLCNELLKIKYRKSYKATGTQKNSINKLWVATD